MRLLHRKSNRIMAIVSFFQLSSQIIQQYDVHKLGQFSTVTAILLRNRNSTKALAALLITILRVRGSDLLE